MHKHRLQLIDSNGENYQLNKTRSFIGSNTACDICFDDNSVANFHAMIFINEQNQYFIMDLKSKNAIKVNGVSIDTHQLQHDDLISIGAIKCHASFETTLSLNLESSEPTQLVSNQSVQFIENTLDANFSFEDKIINWSQLVNVHSVDLSEYHDTGLNLSLNHTVADFKQSSQFLGFEITLFCGDLVIQKEYFKSKQKTYYAKNDLSFDFLGDQPLLCVGENVEYIVPTEFLATVVENNKSLPIDSPFLKLNQNLFLQRGSITIVITYGYFNQSYLPQTFFDKDVEFYKQTTKVFATLFLPLLLLIFFKPELKEEEKEIAVIYKKISTENVEPQMQESEKVAAIDKGTGQPSPDQSKTAAQEIKVAKSADRSPASTQPVENIATPTPEAPKKTFQFNGLAKLNQMVADSPKLAAVSNDISQLTNSSASNVLNKGNINALDSVSSGVDNLGSSDYSGTLKGKGGLSSKKGFDTSYIEAKTVVLGSMDPELLRKILREYIPQFRHCYQKELLTNDQIKGILDLNFRILGNGKVSNIDILAKDAKFSKGGSDCMAGVLNLIDFPKPQGGGVVDIRQPLNFVSERQRI